MLGGPVPPLPPLLFCRFPHTRRRLITHSPHHHTQVAAATGSLTRWSVSGTDLLQAPVLPLFFRAPTDNDRGGSGGNSHANR